MRDVILFEQMASRETDPERKEALEKQAKAFRKLADNRAKELGLAPLEPPPLLRGFSLFLCPTPQNLRLNPC
jgi:hypothetical protein